MKWFKHMSNASDDAFIEELESIFGLEGYARWWKLLEIVAKEMGEKGETSATHSWSKWCSFLKVKRNKLETFLVHCQNQSRINLKQTGNVLEIDIPKMACLRDEWVRKLRSKSGATPAQEVDTELDTEKEIPPTPQKKMGGVLPIPKNPKNQENEKWFNEFWGVYPKKVARAAVKRHWEKRKLDKFAEAIIDAVKRYRATEKWQEAGGQFIPNPLTFLNQERWNDEITPHLTVAPTPTGPRFNYSPAGETAEEMKARQMAEEAWWEEKIKREGLR